MAARFVDEDEVLGVEGGLYRIEKPLPQLLKPLGQSLVGDCGFFLKLHPIRRTHRSAPPPLARSDYRSEPRAQCATADLRIELSSRHRITLLDRLQLNPALGHFVRQH